MSTYSYNDPAREAAYRRGVHHGIALAADLAEQATSLRAARRELARAERLAARLRERPDRPGSIDAIRRRLAEHRRGTGGTPAVGRTPGPPLTLDVEPFHPGEDA